MKETIIAVAYLRYSCHAQDESQSLASQTATIEAYIKANNIEIESWYADSAKTGRNEKRPQYQKMKKDLLAEDNKAKCVIVRDLSRLHRNTKNQLADLEWFEQHGIRFISITDGIDTAENPSKIIVTIKAAIAEEYSDNLARNTRAAMLECAKQCRHLGGKPPLGYIVNSEGFYEIDELKAPIIRDIFKLYLQDMGYDYIIKYLKEKGYKTANNADFTKSSLKTILCNKKYMGTYVYDKSTPINSEGKRNSHTVKNKYIEIADGMPALVSKEDFHKVQKKMSDKTKKQMSRPSKNYYALNGVMHCSNCHHAFTGNVCTSNNKKYLNYRGNCQCDVKGIRVEKLNKFVFHAIKECIFNEENQDKIISRMNAMLDKQKLFQSEDVNALMNKINGLENAQNNLTGFLENGKGTATILDKLQKNETELEILKTQLEAKSKSISQVDTATYNRLVKKFVNYMCVQKSPEAIALRNAAIKDIIIGADDVVIKFNSGVTVDDETLKYFNNVEG